MDPIYHSAQGKLRVSIDRTEQTASKPCSRKTIRTSYYPCGVVPLKASCRVIVHVARPGRWVGVVEVYHHIPALPSRKTGIRKYHPLNFVEAVWFLILCDIITGTPV